MSALAKTNVAPAPKPVLPAYALDGRVLNWSQTGSAVWFESTEDEYHSDVDAASASALKQMARSPAHLQEWRRAATSGGGRSAAKAFGTALHCAVLESQDFAKRYAVYSPEKASASPRATKVFKEFEARNIGRRVITRDEFARVVTCARQALATTVIRSDEGAYTLADLVQVGIKERTYYWVDAATGVTCKARLDLTVQHVLIDLKTTQDARENRFKWDAEKFGYHIQAAFYMQAFRQFLPEGTEPIMLFLVAESAAPHACKVYQADADEFWKLGQLCVKKLLLQYQDCMQSQHWPGYETGPQLLKLPGSTVYNLLTNR